MSSIADVILGTDTTSGLDVALPYKDRRLGVSILGKQGTGKSTLLERMILQDLANHTPGFVIDPHGLLAERVASLANPQDADRIILLDPLEAVFGLNPFAYDKGSEDLTDLLVDGVVETIKKLYKQSDAFAPRLERYLRRAARTLIPGGHTLLEVERVFDNSRFREQCLSQIQDEEERVDLRTKWQDFDALRAADQSNQTEALLNRLEDTLGNRMMRTMLGAPHTTVPFDAVLKGDGMLLISLPSRQLTRERCNFVGSLVLISLAQRLFTRALHAVEEPPRLHVYIDEYERFASPMTAQLLAEGRKFGVGMTLAHQSMFQINDSEVRNASRLVGALIALELTRPDAELLAGEFPITPRPEQTETIEEVDGTEAKQVFSPTPAEDIFLTGHSNKEVDELARSFLAYSPRWTMDRVLSTIGVERGNEDTVHFLGGDPRKSAGVEPRGGVEPLHPQVQVAPYDLNELFVEAMEGKLQPTGALAKKLILTQLWAPLVELGLPEDPHTTWTRARLGEGDYSTLFYPLPNRSPSIRKTEHCRCAEIIDEQAKRGPELYTIGPRRPRRSDDPLGLHLVSCRARQLTREGEAFNANVDSAYQECVKGFLGHTMTRWLIHHLDDPVALRQGRNTDTFEAYNVFLAQNAWVNWWNARWEWEAEIVVLPDGSLDARTAQRAEMVDEEEPERRLDYREMVTYATMRLRYIDYLCEALYHEPVMTNSGERQHRRRTRHIVHPAQTEQDALNEFARELTHPTDEFRPHVRLKSGHFQPRLEDVDESQISSRQLREIKDRSAKLYSCAGDVRPALKMDEKEVTQKNQELRRHIGRRPGSQRS